MEWLRGCVYDPVKSLATDPAGVCGRWQQPHLARDDSGILAWLWEEGRLW